MSVIIALKLAPHCRHDLTDIRRSLVCLQPNEVTLDHEYIEYLLDDLDYGEPLYPMYPMYPLRKGNGETALWM